jgi:hypothetical protein
MDCYLRFPSDHRAARVSKGAAASIATRFSSFRACRKVREAIATYLLKLVSEMSTVIEK